jgi:hypothetical protein
MSHIRTRIRQNLVTTLKGMTHTDQKVFDSRIYPMNMDTLPGICVYTPSETSGYLSISPPRTLDKVITASIEIYVQMIDEYDERLDQIAADAEEKLYTDLTRGGLATDTKVLSFDSTFSGDVEQPVIMGKLTVEIRYSAVEGSPEG